MLPLLAGAGAFAFTRTLSMAGTDPADPLADIVTDSFVIDLDRNDGAVLRRRADIPYNGRAQALLVKLPVYVGPLTPPRIAAVVAAGQAEALEPRLAPVHREALAGELSEVERDLTEATLSLLEEQRIAKDVLDTRGGDIWEISGDPASEEYRRAQAQMLAAVNPLLAKHEASLTTDARNGRSKHYLLRRSEFSIYMQYVDLQSEFVRERGRIVREWIAGLWRDQGLAVFRPSSAGPRDAQRRGR